MANLSDRGGAGPSSDALADLHREDLRRHARGEPPPIDVGDIRALDGERIAALNDTHGAMAVASAIQLAAVQQLRGVKLEIDNLPGDARARLVGEMRDDGLSADEQELVLARARTRQRGVDMHQRLRVQARTDLGNTIVELCGGDVERANKVWRSLGEHGVDRLLRVHSRDRRKELARTIERAEIERLRAARSSG